MTLEMRLLARAITRQYEIMARTGDDRERTIQVLIRRFDTLAAEVQAPRYGEPPAVTREGGTDARV